MLLMSKRSTKPSPLWTNLTLWLTSLFLKPEKGGM